MYLSAHFDLDEFITSETATRYGIDNTPNDDIVDNLRFLASMMEEVRILLGNKPITIKSGYRCPKLNSAIGGSKTSQHMQGLAADFICPQYGTPYDIADEISRSDLRFDQLIYEGANGSNPWIHMSVSDQPRGDRLTAYFNPTRYVKGIVK